ncbi:prolactin-releasing peptide receptor-like [Stylophora pistillata]|uniref:prolactin-releasing peptide receptor-like n=1 Tax=Stylophora pistillata TaxID=50429 RepID=UPI000C04FBF4|nr:prolactin-releasing peptide receptor-like [Stylophora pistillata]
MASSPLNNFSTEVSLLNRTMEHQGNFSSGQGHEDELFDPLSYKIMVITFFSVIFAFGFLGNVSVLGTILKLKQLRNPCGFLIGTIALADLGVALVAAPLRIADLYLKGWPFGGALCRLIVPLQDVLVCVSVVTHSTIAWERYRATVTPFKPRLSATRIKFVILGIWVSCYIFSGLPLVIPLKLLPFNGALHCLPAWSDLYRRIYEIYLVLVFIVAQLIIQSYAYVSIIRTLKTKSDVIEMVEKDRKISTASGASIPFNSGAPCTAMVVRMKRKRKLVKMLLVLVTGFQICHLPRGVTMLYREFADPVLITPAFNYIDLVALALYYLKHVINPLILFTMSEDFRSGMELICGCYNEKKRSKSDTESTKLVTTRLEDTPVLERRVNTLETTV